MIREPAVSGTFYPGNAKALAADIEQYLSQAAPGEIKGEIKGLIAPHAGYMYSGPVAAWGYKALSGRRYDTVIVIAPSHRSYFSVAAVQERGGYRTPLGVVEIDEEFAADLLRRRGPIISDVRVHRDEHSLEVQIPFLQYVLKDFRMVPLIMGAHEVDLCEELASTLFRAMEGSPKQFLVVGSTDLSHYYPYRHAVELDGQVVARLNNFDVKGLIQDLASEKCEACGAGPIITTMMVSRQMGADAGKVMKYANSGDVSGDKSTVVGYVSSVFYRKGDGRDG
jgi:MEMO1 family protein